MMKDNKDNICHVTTVHPRYDIRIFEKECKSLLKYYSVQLIVADGLGDETKEGIRIADVGKEIHRIRSMVISPWKTYKIIKNTGTKVIHLHDPELIPIGILLKIRGYKIIFDIHEDIYEQIKIKDWIPGIVKFLLLPLIKIFNIIVSFNFNLIFAELSYIKSYSNSKNKYQTDVLNYPQTKILKHFINNNRTENGIIYVGSITNLRGLDIILDALMILKKDKVDFKMHFVGILKEDIDWEYYKSIREHIKFYGYLGIKNAYKISIECKVGLAILKPVGNYIESIPTKIFEYRAVHLPFIASDFKAWKDYFPKAKDSLYINPQSPLDLSKALTQLLLENGALTHSGDCNQKEVIHKFTWESEEKKLITIYENILFD